MQYKKFVSAIGFSSFYGKLMLSLFIQFLLKILLKIKQAFMP